MERTPTMDLASSTSFEKIEPGKSVESLVRYETWDQEKNGEPEVVANMETIALKACEQRLHLQTVECY
jgi:hypothetical protein